VVLYVGLGVTTVLILRNMARRYRKRDVADSDVPYGPREPALATPAHEDVTVS
jgi:cytochrome d ubiquinol oxidase subunit I